MASIVGFTLLNSVSPDTAGLAVSAQRQVLSCFPHLRQTTVKVGESRLDVWGHGEVSERVYTMPDGSVLALIGSPTGPVSWVAVADDLVRHDDLSFEPRWDGRFILLRVSSDGRRWTMWNDWVGSIPVFHGTVGAGRIASTLELVVADGLGSAKGQIFFPALVCLLINGHLLSDWTLYEHVKIAPPDSVVQWCGTGFRATSLGTVVPSQDRWESSWDELVDTMFEVSRAAIVETLRMAPRWILPLSAGLDSRLIAAIAAEQGIEVRTFAWGSRDSLDVVYSRETAKALGLPWSHVGFDREYLLRYSTRWAAMFGTSLHFHGMYQMAFLDALDGEAAAPAVIGFLGDVLSATSLYPPEWKGKGQFANDWYTHWLPGDVETLVRAPIQDALDGIDTECQRQFQDIPGMAFQRLALAEIWSRQRFFTSFHSTLSDYWRGVATPFLNKRYVQFCLSLPRAAVDDRRLLADMYRRHLGPVATIPGTYAPNPLIRTGRFLLKRRLARILPVALHIGPLRGFRNDPPRMDNDCVRATGWPALWPIREGWDELSAWLDVSKLDEAYKAVISDRNDYRALRRLQSVQPLAYALLRYPELGHT